MSRENDEMDGFATRTVFGLMGCLMFPVTRRNLKVLQLELMDRKEQTKLCLANQTGLDYIKYTP